MSSRGWVTGSPAKRLLHASGPLRLVAMGSEEKLLPSSVIRQVANERAEKLAEEQGFPVGRKQMRDLRLQVAEELKSRALCRRRELRALIDLESGLLLIDSASAKAAEELVELLRDTLGSFAAVPVATAHSPAAVMSAWLGAGDATHGFTIDDTLELRGADKNGGAIRYTRCPPESRELRSRLAAGMVPASLALTWRGRIAFRLTEKLALRQIEFLETVDEDEAATDDVDPVEMFEATMLLAVGELRQLLADLREALGGEAQAPSLAESAAA
jgi:recombination associated protein RdgC